MTELERLYHLKIRSRVEHSFKERLFLRLSKLWKQSSLEKTSYTILLTQAGFSKFASLWVPLTFFITVIVVIITFLAFNALSSFLFGLVVLYFMLFRLVNWCRVERRLTFSEDILGFVSGLEMVITQGKNLEHSIEFVLERAPEGLFRHELSQARNKVSSSGLKNSLVDQVYGREAEILSSSFNLLTGVPEIQKEGIKKLYSCLGNVCGKLNERARERSLFYKLIFVCLVSFIIVDILAASFIAGFAEKSVFSLMLIGQMIVVFLASEAADSLVSG